MRLDHDAVANDEFVSRNAAEPEYRTMRLCVFYGIIDRSMMRSGEEKNYAIYERSDRDL
jgi:hypothetical protein